MHEKNRKKLILDALGEHFKDNMIDNLDLNDFEKRFVKLHYPLNSTFKILCKSCHKKYDNVTGSFEVENFEVEDNKDFILESNLIIKETLEIEFNPSDILEFKELLLTNKSANITTLYNNNTSEVKEWNASNMTEKSDIIRNLRSRKEFRQGEWQKLGIEKVEVSINYN